MKSCQILKLPIIREGHQPSGRQLVEPCKHSLRQQEVRPGIKGSVQVAKYFFLLPYLDELAGQTPLIVTHRPGCCPPPTKITSSTGRCEANVLPLKGGWGKSGPGGEKFLRQKKNMGRMDYAQWVAGQGALKDQDMILKCSWGVFLSNHGEGSAVI